MGAIKLCSKLEICHYMFWGVLSPLVGLHIFICPVLPLPPLPYPFEWQVVGAHHQGWNVVGVDAATGEAGIARAEAGQIGSDAMVAALRVRARAGRLPEKSHVAMRPPDEPTLKPRRRRAPPWRVLRPPRPRWKPAREESCRARPPVERVQKTNSYAATAAGTLRLRSSDGAAAGEPQDEYSMVLLLGLTAMAPLGTGGTRSWRLDSAAAGAHSHGPLGGRRNQKLERRCTCVCWAKDAKGVKLETHKYLSLPVGLTHT